MANIVKFEVGAMYWDTSAVDHECVMAIKIARRTEKSVWFVRVRDGKEDGEPSRTKIFTDATREYAIPYKYSMAPVWTADRKVEDATETTDPEADAVTPDEPETETPEATQEAANEPEAAQEQTEEAKAHDLYVRARELRERAEGLCEEGKLHENFVRSVQKVELQAYRAAAHESAVRLASENPRVAAAMERLRPKQAAPNDKPQVFERKPTFEVGGVYRNEAQEAGKDTIKVTARSGCVVTFVWNGQEMTADVRFDDPGSEYILIGLKPFFASELETGEEPVGAERSEPATEAMAKPSPEFNYDYLSGHYAIFSHADGVFSNEYETDDLKEAREYLKAEVEGTVKHGDYAIFDRDARRYIQIHATSKGRKAFKAENERLAVKAAMPASQAEPETTAGQPVPQEAATSEGDMGEIMTAVKSRKAKPPKQYTIRVTRDRTGRAHDHTGTLEELIQAFSYTLEKGKSWEWERGRRKINLAPKTARSLVSNLQNAADNAAANGYSGVCYELVTV